MVGKLGDRGAVLTLRQQKTGRALHRRRAREWMLWTGFGASETRAQPPGGRTGFDSAAAAEVLAHVSAARASGGAAHLLAEPPHHPCPGLPRPRPTFRLGWLPKAWTKEGHRVAWAGELALAVAPVSPLVCAAGSAPPTL